MASTTEGHGAASMIDLFLPGGTGSRGRVRGGPSVDIGVSVAVRDGPKF